MAEMSSVIFVNEGYAIPITLRMRLSALFAWKMLVLVPSCHSK